MSVAALHGAVIAVTEAGSHRASGGTAQAFAPTVRAVDLRLMEETILRLTNRERGKEGLPELRFSKPLAFLGRKHSQHMCDAKTLEHTSQKLPEGWRNLGERLRHIGLRNVNWGENIALRTAKKDPQEWAQEVVASWMQSPTHRGNIISRDFSYLGVGTAACDRDIVYATQVFASEPGKLPTEAEMP